MYISRFETGNVTGGGKFFGRGYERCRITSNAKKIIGTLLKMI